VTYVQIAAGVKEEVAEQLRVWLNEIMSAAFVLTRKNNASITTDVSVLK